MSNILIYKDETQIRYQKESINGAIPYFQEVCNQMAIIEITATIPEIVELCKVPRGASGSTPSGLSQYVNNGQEPPYKASAALIGFVQEKYLQKAGTPNFGGVPIKQEKLKEMLELPDLTSLGKAMDGLTDYASMQQHHNPFSLLNYIQLSNGKVSLKSTASQQIEDAASHYTANSKGIAITNKIKALITAIEEYEAHVGNKIPADRFKSLNIEGITVRHDNKLVPNVSFVRIKEK